MSFDNTNRGQIWGNDKKEKDSQPDFKGDINVDGKEYWISAWKRKPDANPKAPALSFSIQPKDQNTSHAALQAAPQGQPVQNNGTGAGDGLDDDIPFMRLDSF